MAKTKKQIRRRDGRFASPRLIHRITLGNSYNKTQLLLLVAIIIGTGYFIYHSLAVTTSATVTGKDYLGISSGGNLQWQSQAQIKDRLDKIRDSGARWLRFDIAWSNIQSSGPNSYNWTAFDFVVDQANARGIKILGTIDYTPVWARPSGTDSHYPPTNPNDYAKFAATAAAHYAPKGVHYWEIWNEPNQGSQFWKPKANPAAYTALLKATYPKIKQADPNGIVISGGLSPCGKYGDWCDSGKRENPVSFLEQMYANGAAGFFDAVGWHPYAGGAYPAGTVADWSAWYQMYGSVNPAFPNARSLMSARGDTAKKIWMTEFGYCTNCNDSRSVTESQQAVNLTTAYSLIKGYGWAGPLFWFNDENMGSSSAADDNFGLRRFDGSMKPAYFAYQKTAASFTVPDTIKPTVIWKLPDTTNITVTGSQTFLVNAQDNTGGSGIDHVSFYANGKLLGNGQVFYGYYYTWDTVAAKVADGTYTIVARAFDKAGNVKDSSPVSAAVANHSQTGTIVWIGAPANNAGPISGTVTVGVGVKDPAGVNRIDMYANGTYIGAAPCSIYGCYLNWNSTAQANGTISLIAKEYSKNGAVNVSAPITVTVRNTVSKPQVTWLFPTVPYTVIQLPLGFNADADGTNGNSISLVEYYDENNRLVGSAALTYGYLLPLQRNQLSSGNHLITIKATDSGGHTNTSPVMPVIIKN